ncbi:MAG: flavin reductase [Butyricimonas virosa]
MDGRNLLKTIWSFALLVMLSCGPAVKENTDQPDIMEIKKKNLGSLLALYPKPMTVVGTKVEGKVNWLVVGHTGIIGHDRILVSMSKQHYSNQGIKKLKKFSINLVSREMLPKADYVGSVSGEMVDKSDVFAYHIGENGTPVIDVSPLTMECNVVDIYETEGFDNFICTVVNTYASPDVLGSDGKLDYTRLKPVLFEFPTYSYLATGEVIGKCLNLDEEPGMCAKQPMAVDGIVRLSKIEVYPEYLEEYMKFATEVGEVSLRTEPGVLTMYAVSEKENPCMVTILETYASQKAYELHVTSEHFQKYKQGTLHMVKRLTLSDQTPLNPANQINNFIQ